MNEDVQLELLWEKSAVQKLFRNEFTAFDSLNSAEPMSVEEVVAQTGLAVVLMTHLLLELQGQGLTNRVEDGWLRQEQKRQRRTSRAFYRESRKNLELGIIIFCTLNNIGKASLSSCYGNGLVTWARQQGSGSGESRSHYLFPLSGEVLRCVSTKVRTAKRATDNDDRAELDFGLSANIEAILMDSLDELTYSRRLSDTAVRAYRAGLMPLLTGLDHTSELLTPVIRAHLGAKHAGGVARSSLARLTTSIRQFCSWLVAWQTLDVDPSLRLSAPKKYQHLPEVFSSEKVEKATEKVSSEDSTVVTRDLVIVELLYVTRMRVEELCKADVSDVNFFRHIISVMGKGDKQRIVPFGAPAEAVPKGWLQVRGNFPVSAQAEYAPLLGVRGSRLNSRQARRVIRKRAGVSSHTLRYSAVTAMMEDGANSRVVQEMLGHFSLATTWIYTHVLADRLREVHKRIHPRA